MSSKLFVGGLPWAADESALREAFEPFGTVQDAVIVTDRDTGRSRGFGFVTFETPDQASAAVDAMNGARIGGRPVTVREARERSGGGGAPRRHPGPPRGPGPGGPRPPRTEHRGPPRGRPPGGDRGGYGGGDRGGYGGGGDRGGYGGGRGGYGGDRGGYGGGDRGGYGRDRGPRQEEVRRDEWGFVESAPEPRGGRGGGGGGPAYDPTMDGDPEASGWLEDRQRRRERPAKKRKQRYRRDEDEGDW